MSKVHKGHILAVDPKPDASDGSGILIKVRIADPKDPRNGNKFVVTVVPQGVPRDALVAGANVTFHLISRGNWFQAYNLELVNA